ncbi:MAG: ArsR family transcriptional regulator [Candidatus Thorarchaeota archaeon]
MSDDLEKIRKELEEVRRLKEELRREVEDVRREKEDEHRLRAEERRRRAEIRRPVRPPKPPRAPRVPRVPRVAKVDLDLEGLTESLETMMDGLGDQIEMSLRSVEGIKVPGIRVTKGKRRSRKRREQRSEIESIAPERVAQIVSPLGSEERLKILDYLKTGGKSFNDIENYTGKTGSSLTHHLNPLIEAGYVVKGEVRGTYYVTVEGRLAYRLAQWLTHRVEKQRERTGSNGDVDVEFDDTDSEDTDLEKAEQHLEALSNELEEAQGELEAHQDELEGAQDELEAHQDALEEARESLEETRERELEALEEAREALEEQLEEEEDLDDLDWDD